MSVWPEAKKPLDLINEALEIIFFTQIWYESVDFTSFYVYFQHKFLPSAIRKLKLLFVGENNLNKGE
jgi:hypothetical protein